MAEPSPPAAAAAEAAQHIIASGDSHHQPSHEPTQDMPVPEEEGPGPGESHDDDDENDTTTATGDEDEKAPAARNRPQSALPSDRQLRLAQSENRQLRDEVERMQREIEQLRRGSGAIQDFDDDGAETPPRGGGGGGVGKLGKAIGRKLTRRSSPLYESVSVVESPEKAGAAAVHHRRGGHASGSGSGGAADQDVEAGWGASKRVGGTRKAKLSDTEEDDHGRDSFADHDLHPVNIDGSMVAASADQTEVIGNGVDGDIPFRDVVKDRAGWLVGLLVLQSCSSFILARNEALLESHLVIVQFLTMLVGAGGNAGNQASVRVIRGLAVGTLNERTLKPFLWTEAKMGLALSVILGLAGFLRATVFMVPIAETVAITTSLYMIVISSVCIGALLPLAMYRCGLDPAHSSTTIQVLMDILGVTMTVWVSGAILNTSVGPALTAFFHHGAVAAAEAGADDLDAGGAGSSGDDLMEGVE